MAFCLSFGSSPDRLLPVCLETIASLLSKGGAASRTAPLGPAGGG